MKTRSFAVVMFVLAQVAITGLVQADGRGHRHASTPPLSQVEGTITAVSSTSITVHDSHGTDVVLAVTSTTIIRKGDQPITAADLHVGDRVHVATSSQNNTNTAVLIVVQTPEDESEVEGTIAAVSATSITVHDSHGNDVVLALTSKTIIRRGDQTLTAGDLKVGDQVHVQAQVVNNTRTALEIVVQQQVDLLEVEGTITAASATSITVHDSHGASVILMLTDSTVIRKGDQTIAATGLKVGDHVHVMAAVQGSVNTAVLIIVQGSDDGSGSGGTIATANGTVTATTGSQLTVHTEESGEMTVTTNSSTIVRKQGTVIAVADIHVGDGVNCLGTKVADHTILARQIEVRGSGSGHH